MTFFAVVLFIQRIFVRPCELANISQTFFSPIVGIVLGPSVFGVSGF